MGWDCFYEGTLSDEDLQEKIALFLLDFSEGCVIIKPEISRYFMTKKYGKNGIEASHPFNYFGVVSDTFPHGMQFIFDRSAGGELISFEKIPDEYADGFEFYKPGELEELDEFEVVLDPKADVRRGYFMAFALSVIKLRWWPTLLCADDTNSTASYLYDFYKYGLVRKILDERNNLHQCHDIWEKEYHKYYPPRQEDDTVIEVSKNEKPKLVVTKKSDLDIKLNDLDLSVRLTLKLEKTDLETVGDLVKFSKGELVSKYNLTGRKLMREIEEAVGEYGLFLKDE